MRHPTLLVGLTMDRERAGERIDARVDAMVAAGAAEEVREAADARGLAHRARRARLRRADWPTRADVEVDAIKTAQWRYARRQLTWMRRMEGVELIDRTGLSDARSPTRILELLGSQRYCRVP